MPAKKPTAKKTAKNKGEVERLVLLDSHAILHRAYHALPEFSSSKAEPTGALYGLCTMLIKIVAELKPDYVVACYDLPEKTYRHEAYDAYKAGRKKTDDALVAQLIRSRDVFKAFNIPMYENPGFEADDMLGTIVEQMKDNESLDIIIASGDMDTLQLVKDKKVQVYTLKKGIKDTILYDEEAVKQRYGFKPLLLPDYKGLRGDPSDNIIGIKGIGEKSASDLIWNFGTIEEMYVKLKKNRQAFLDAGIKERIIGLLEAGEEEARFSKMLATIRRDAPIDFKLPEQKWKASLDLQTILNLFSELEFRSLGARVRDSLGLQPTLGMSGGETLGGAGGSAGSTVGGKGAVSSGADEDANLDGLDDMAGQTDGAYSGFSTPATPLSEISEKELKETSLALWVINSNIVMPGLEEIYQFSGTNDFKKAREIILERIEKDGLKEVYAEIELPLMPVVVEMQERGVKVDKEYLADLSKKYHKELERLQKKIWEYAGEEFNVNSPKQLGVILFEKMALTAKNLKKTDGGARSTRESELEKMRDSHPIIGLIVEYRELQKLLSTYIDNIPNMLDENNRLHATFQQAGTTTGRMSSNNPNLQNIPIKTELGRNIRNAFIAEKGFTLMAFDYSQIELRIAAFLSRDKKMVDIFKNGEDIHTAVASQVFKVPLDRVDKEMRRRAKVINFGILYGMGINALKQNLGTDRKLAQEFYNEYFANFSTLASYLAGVKAYAAKTGYTETLFGRKRSFEGIKSKIPFIRAAAERMAINAPIQGTEADLVKLAMVRIHEFVKKEGLEGKIYPLLQVHDELVYEVKKDLVETIAPKIQKIMEKILDGKETLGVPIEVHAYQGLNWGEMDDTGVKGGTK